VPVFGWQTDRFPAFYRRDSGLPVDRRFDALSELSTAVAAHLDLGLGTGVVIGNPIQADHEMPADLYERSLAEALRDAAARGVRGREVTPFLLEKLRDLTDGASVFSNRALLRANAGLAGRLAKELASG
jgi:pseudouridine-5'-phosphate glycosidase